MLWVVGLEEWNEGWGLWAEVDGGWGMVWWRLSECGMWIYDEEIG